MEKLALCSKVLFDHDVMEKSKRIVDLESELAYHSPPKKEYRCEREWLEMLESVKGEIVEFIGEMMQDDVEYNWVETMGVTPRWSSMILDMLRTKFVELSGEPKWSESIAHLIWFNLKESIDVLLRSGAWSILFHTMEREGIIDIFTRNILSQFDCIYTKTGIGSIHTIPWYRCVECHKRTDVCFDDVDEKPYCPDCAEKNGVDLDYDPDLDEPDSE